MALANQPAKAPAADLTEGLSGPAASPITPIVAGDAPIAIPQASLLFDADFVRSGDDLTLVGHDGQELLIVDYFGAGAPDLIAPNQAMLDGQTVTLLAGPQFPGQYAQAGGATQPAEPIGSVETLQGTVTAQRADGTTYQLKVGDPVFESDVVTTGPGANIGMKLADGTLVTLQESGKLAINEFVYQADGADNSALLNVIQGTFSLFAGQVAPTGDMQIKTPIATMGIRGTSILGVNVDAILGRLSLTQDPDGHVGFIEIFNNQNGNLFTVLRTVFEKITISESGLLSLTPKTPEELSIDQTLTELLHNFYNQVPQQGPDTSPQPQTGSPRFETPNIQEIIFDPAGPQDGTELLLPQELLEQFLESLLEIQEIRDEIILALSENPTAGEITLDDQPEGEGGDTGAGEGGGTIDTTLPFDFGSSGPGSVGFKALDGKKVVDANGDPVTSGGAGEQLVYVWNATTNTLTAVIPGDPGVQDDVSVFTIVVDPTTGEVTVTINGAVDHLGGNDLFLPIDIPFTVQAANGATATGTLTVVVSDDVPVAMDDAPQQVSEGGQSGISGNLIDNDDQGADGAALTHVDLGDGQGFREITSGAETQPGSDVYSFATAAGIYTFAADGTWTFVPSPGLDNAQQPADASFGYRITDGDSDTSEASQPISVLDGQPVVVDATDDIILNEANLPNGSSPNQAALTQEGSFADNFDFGGDGKGEVLQIVHDGVIYTPDEGGQIVISGDYWTLTVQATGPDAGDYVFELTDNTLEHGPDDDGANTLELPSFDVTMSDGDGSPETVSLNVGIADDAPAASNDRATVENGNGGEKNLVIMIDISGSMGESAGLGDGTTRLDLAKQTAINLINGTNLVNVMVVAFATVPFFNSPAWAGDKTDAAEFIGNLEIGSVNGIPIGESTNYELALVEAGALYKVEHQTADSTSMYVFSDGGDKIGWLFDKFVWNPFLDRSDIDEVIPVGVGDGLSGSEIDALDTVGYNHDPVVIDDQFDLVNTLSGNVLTDDTGEGTDDFGADGGEGVASLVIDGETFTPGQDGNVLDEMTDQGGRLLFDFDSGAWEYLPPGNESLLPYENFRYTITDGDGDTSTASLTIVIDPERVDEVIQGDTGNNILGVDANEYLSGLVDSSSELSGGYNEPAGDLLVGGLGSDTFVLDNYNVEDFIADYEFGEGDEIDLSGLLPAQDVNQNNIDQYLRIVENGDGGADELQIDTTGSGQFQQPATVAYLNGDAGVNIIVEDGGGYVSHPDNPNNIA